MNRKRYLLIIGSGIVFGFIIMGLINLNNSWYQKVSILLIGLGLALIVGFLWVSFINAIKRLTIQDLLFKVFAVIGSMLITMLWLMICKPFLELLPIIWNIVATFTSALVFMALGLSLVNLKVKDLKVLFFTTETQSKTQAAIRNQLKVVDTSAIIDGRIADLCKTGFLEGVLIIPTFVIAELQKIADSADSLRRNRGRRGLDLLNRIQKENLITTRIFDRNYEELNEVDTKLLRLAREIGAKVVTNDFNLNKVAEIYGVQVLNINELSNAIKPAVLPGEEMAVHVLRDGKESGQGIGYLEDGTMIVVEGGKDYIGLDIEILVTSVLQTAAGRMIFAKPKDYVITRITS